MSSNQAPEWRKTELFRAEMNNIGRYVDHYATITRQSATDLYKSLILANAAALIYTLSASASIKKDEGGHLTPFLQHSFRGMFFLIALGIGLAIYGYIITFQNARDNLVLWREQLSKAMDSDEFRVNHPNRDRQESRIRIVTVCSVLQFIVLVFSAVWLAIKVS